MKTFKHFINEAIIKDNPGGTWLKVKQEDAEKNIEKHKGITGAVTGYYKNTIKLPVDKLKHLPGARDEHIYRDNQNSEKNRNLEKEIEKPENFDSKKYPIFVGINHKGDAHVVEGNHRLSYAQRHGIKHIHATVRYYNGGETSNGHMSPDKIEKIKIT